MTNNAIKRSLLESLNVYVKHFDALDTLDELLAISTSILTSQQQHGNLATSNKTA